MKELDEAIKKAGGEDKLAKKLRVRKNTVIQWRCRKRIPWRVQVLLSKSA